MKVGVSYIREDKLGQYVDAVALAGLEPVPIAPKDARGLDGLAGLVITGGGDVDPSLYGEEPDPRTNHVIRERDDLEVALIREAEQKDLPILGICRGLQILNVARGGTLRQHIEGHREVKHSVRTREGSAISVFVGADEYEVNSLHHQAAGRIGQGLVVTASAADGTVEALEDPGRRFVVTVQWHPEQRVAEPACRDLRIFRAFAKAVGA